MDSLQIARTNETPEIVLDKMIGKYEISGRSLGDNPSKFYGQVIEWMKEYALAPNPTTVFDFKFEYINIESSKSILDLLKTLEGIQGASVSWYFNDEDEDMEEIGEELAALVQIPFEFKSY